MRLELEIAQDIGAQLMDEVRACRDLKARGELARERGAADLGLRLEHEHRAAASCQRRGAYQAVVAGAHHDAIVAFAQCSLPRSLSTARAAFAPGAPMTPPPGCVLEPHMYSPRTGARYCAKPGTGRLKSSWSMVSSPWKMLPSVKPTSFSMSQGVRISACRIRFLKLGLCRAMVSITVLPNPWRLSASQGPSASSYGQYCTNTD